MVQIRRLIFVLSLLFAATWVHAQDKPVNIGGVYPHLAVMNNEGECGIGAVVPWADRLWVITYAPHKPKGSSDKLYEITPTLEKIIRPESIGGTPANRMIHRESQQLSIGPYFIDKDGNVRVIPYNKMPGRHTATARHLTDPANKLYIATMEEGLYEVDVNTLDFKCWINDGNRGVKTFDDAVNSKLPGYHGKGAYAAGGSLYYANNGENSREARVDPMTPSGALAVWGMSDNDPIADRSQDWRLMIREQFTEVTGPGGIYGNANENDPAWSLGWDHKSILLVTMQGGRTSATYRLPKASFTYDGAHGWNTEWPRIREIGEGDNLLATMHGTFWKFPKTFSADNPFGIRPRSNYLKVIGDFARWGERVVLGCDDSAQKEFLNTRPTKAEHGAPQRSNSNLWFVKPEQLSQLGPALGSGGVWLNEDVGEESPLTSEQYLFAGYDHRMLHLAHDTDEPITFIIETIGGDAEEDNLVAQVKVPANGYVPYIFNKEQAGEWVRVTPKRNAKNVTAWFHYADQDKRTTESAAIFNGLATAKSINDLGGVIRSLGGDDLPLGLVAQHRENDDRPFYLLNEKLELVPSDDEQRRDATAKAAAPNPDDIPLKVDGNSILVEEDGKRYRLPLNPNRAEDKTFGEKLGFARRVREVATERDLVNVGGTFYELPARNAGGFAHIRPIASHPYRIHDYASWRGLLLLTGVGPASDNDRIIRSADGKAAVWAGVIDELWQLGKPVGVGGPWHESPVKADEPSDPYLMYGYDNKRLQIASDKAAEVYYPVRSHRHRRLGHPRQLDRVAG
ncbi:MAG: hypothetical protein ACPGYV_05770 [Phycisphaeraceae bacterium]